MRWRRPKARNQRADRTRRDGGARAPEAAAISVITLGELRAGVVLARDEATAEARGRRLSAVRAAFAVLVVDERVAERYGEVRGVARSQAGASRPPTC